MDETNRWSGGAAETAAASSQKKRPPTPPPSQDSSSSTAATAGSSETKVLVFTVVRSKEHPGLTRALKMTVPLSWLEKAESMTTDDDKSICLARVAEALVAYVTGDDCVAR